MIGLDAEQKPSTICRVTQGPLPAALDPAHPPTAKPFRAASTSASFIHTAELILPETAYNAVCADLLPQISAVGYSIVMLPLGALLEREFLEAIKHQDVMMLSEGRFGIDNTFTLSNGVLRLYVDKETYEKCGLVGKLDGSTKTKRAKARWVVEIELRSPGMQLGKKGLKRVEWACRKVLHKPVRWLFHIQQTEEEKESSQDILKRYHPVHKTASVQTRRVPSAMIFSPMRGPNLRQQGRKSGDGLELDYDDHVVSLYEWLSLLSLDSPRIRKNDAIDPYLSRYAVPNDDGAGETRTVVRVKCTGFLPVQWFSKLWLNSLLSVRKLANEEWFALVAHEFESGFFDEHQGLTVLRLPTLKSLPAGSSAGTETQSQAADATESRDEFILWELSSSSS